MSGSEAGHQPGSVFQRWRVDGLILAGLLALPVFWFWPVTFGGKTLLPADNLFTFQPWRSFAAQFGITQPYNGLLSDLILENYPWKTFILQSLQAGRLPLWNPYLFAGAPFLAAGQHSALYPFSILYYILPLWQAYGLFTVSQLFLAGAFAYVFARVLGLSRPAALITAISYQFCQFLIVSVVFPMILAGVAWLPLILAAVECVIQQRSLFRRPATLPWLVLGALALGCQILAGHVEITYYTLLVTAAFAGWRLVPLSPCPLVPLSPCLPVSWFAARRRPLIAILVLVGLGLALGAVQLVPLVELVQHNFRRGSASYEQIIGWAYPLRHLLALLVPNFYGNPAHHGYFDLFSGHWLAVGLNAAGQPNPNGPGSTAWGIKNYVEGGAYVGILPLLLALVAVLSIRRRRYILFFTVLAGACLAFAFGTPLYRLVFWLPGINQLHSPFRWMWPFSLCIAVLAGFGAQVILDDRPVWLRHLSGLCILAGLTGLTSLAFSRLFYDRLAGWIDQLFLGLAKAPEAFVNGRAFYSYESPWLLWLALLVLLSGLILRSSDWRPGSLLPNLQSPISNFPIWVILASALIVADLYAASGDFNPAVDPALLTFQPPVVDFLRQDPGLWRLTAYTPIVNGHAQSTKTMNANIAWSFGLADIRGYDSIIPKQYTDYMGLIAPQTELEYNRIAPIYNAAALDSPLLDVLGVKYVLSEQEINSPKYELVYNREVRVYRNREVQPRAFVIPASAAVVTTDAPADLQTHDPRQSVILEQSQLDEVGNQLTSCFDTHLTSNSQSPISNLQSPISIDHDAGNEALLTAQVSTPGWVVLADSDFPGWKAFARPEGSPASEECQVPIVRADGNFRAVFLPAGTWTVRFIYSPLSVKLGLFLSFLAGVSLLFLLGVWAWRLVIYPSATDTNTRRVARNSLAPMILNLLNRGIDFVFATIMLRFLGPGDAGKYYFAIVIIGWFDILTNFGLNTFLTREVARDRSQVARHLASTTFLRLALLTIAIPVLIAVTGGGRSLGAMDQRTTLAVALLFIGQIPASLSAGFTALFYAFEQVEFTAAWSTVTTLLKVTLGLLVLLAGWSFVGLAGVSIVVNCLTLVVLATQVWSRFRPPDGWHFHKHTRQAVQNVRLWWPILLESYPLMLNHLLATLFFKVDVTLLEPMKGSMVVGNYSAAYKFIDAYNVIPAFSTMAIFPLLARQAQDSKEALLRSYRLVIKFLVIVAMGLAVLTTYLARPMVLVLGGNEFLPDGAIALQLMVWSIPIGWINSVTNYALIALGQQRSQTRAFMLGLGFNLIANLLLIPRYSYQAAAVITILSEVVLLLCFYSYLRPVTGGVAWGNILWRPLASAGIMTGVFLALGADHLALAVLVAIPAYLLALLALGAVGPEERAVLVQLLPRRFGARVRETVVGEES